MKYKTITEATKELLAQPADTTREIPLDEDLSKYTTAEYIARVGVAKVLERPKTSSLIELQKIAGEDVERKEISGTLSLEVILKQAEVGNDKD